MAIFKSFANQGPKTPQPIKRGRGRPRKTEQAGQGSEPSTQIVQSPTVRTTKLLLPVNKKWFYAGLVLILAIIPTIYFYAQNKNTEKKLSDLQNKSQSPSTLDEVVKQVGKLVILPSGEQPTLATVSDVAKLQSNPFFAGAANGDKLLYYNKAKKAILYRPSLNKIVEMAPLNSTDQSSP
jgi:hypothetical protein